MRDCVLSFHQHFYNNDKKDMPVVMMIMMLKLLFLLYVALCIKIDIMSNFVTLLL